MEESGAMPDKPHNQGHRPGGQLDQLLGEHLMFALTQAGTLTPQAAALLGEATRNMLGAVISQRPEVMASAAQMSNAALLLRVRGQIDRDLLLPGLSPGALAVKVGLSRRKLYHLFEAEGGVARYILGRRLDRARACLCAGEGPSIKRIAFDHGFSSESQFSRAFKQRFGRPPREVLLNGAARSGRAPEASRFA
jgi:AraC-like DNA-binding protein